MSASSPLQLSLNVTLNASGASPAQADEALDRLAKVLYGMNAQDGVIPPRRETGDPLCFRLSAPLDAPHGGVIGALQMIQMVVLHMGSALSRHHGSAIAYQGEVITGAVLDSDLVGQPVSLGAIDGHRYLLKDSVFRREDGQEAFPEIVAGVGKTAPSGLESLHEDALPGVETTSTVRPRMRR